MVHSEYRQKVTLLGGSLILDRAKSPNLVPRTKPFISILGTVIPVRGATGLGEEEACSEGGSRLEIT